MAHRLTWSPMARFDVRELLAYISADDPKAARKFVQGIFNSVERLPEFPTSGHMVPEFDDPNIREVIRRPCRIVYRLNPALNQIEIVRVWHAARGIPEL